MKVTATAGGPMDLWSVLMPRAKYRVEILSIADTRDRPQSEDMFLAKFAGQENPNKVDIAGATVSSSAVKGGVAKAVGYWGLFWVLG